MIVVLLNALRTGLVPRWMGVLGMFSGLLILLPNVGATLQLIPAFWLVMMGILLGGQWMGGDPPAWEAGEARPWPSRAQMQAERSAKAKGEPVPVPAVAGGLTSRPQAAAGRNLAQAPPQGPRRGRLTAPRQRSDRCTAPLRPADLARSHRG